MQQLIKNIRGVSPVIGALMLTLITITAAASFAVFVSQKQGEIQEQEIFNLMREQESVQVLKINPIINTTDNMKWEELNFTIASLHTRKSTITSISINDCPIKQFKAWRFNKTSEKYISESYSYNESLYLDAREQINIIVNLTTDFFENIIIRTTDYIKIDTFTNLLNSFSKVFIPPTAIIKISVDSLPTCTDYYILDGSLSDHPGEGYIIKWEWNVTNKTAASPARYLDPEPYGRKAQITNSSFIAAGYAYWVNLTVTDNHGMKGKTSFYYDLT